MPEPPVAKGLATSWASVVGVMVGGVALASMPVTSEPAGMPSAEPMLPGTLMRDASAPTEKR